MQAVENELDCRTLAWRREFAPEDTRTVSEYGRDEVVSPGSALSRNYDPDATPWNTEPVNNAHVHTRIRRTAFVKPIQAGGSIAGEVVNCYWLDKLRRGNIGYYWETQDKADDRWDDRFEKILRASSVSAKLPIADKTKFKGGRIIMPHLNFKMLGVISKGSTASDSISHEVLEEVHAWPEGKLAAAEGRTTAFHTSSYFIFIISNASLLDDQLHRALKNGTHQIWETKCPGCGIYHAMRTRWDDRRPELGGLRYDSEGCKQANGEYNYNKLESTIRYQFPCGYAHWRYADSQEDVKRRAILSRNSRYSDPTNPGAHLSNRSYTLEGVSIHHIDWMTLIQDKHLALRALRNGNVDPWIRYVQERECGFYNIHERPNQQRIVLTSDAAKATAEIPDWVHAYEVEIAEEKIKMRGRFAFADKQHGKASDGEAPHYWLVIRDFGQVGGRLKSALVYEGRIETENELDDKIDEMDVHPMNVGIDSGNETLLVYRHCAKRGYAAFKGDGKENGERKTYTHREIDGDGNVFKIARIYDEGTPIDAYLGDPDGRAGRYFVDVFRFCKQSIRDRLAWAMNSGEADYQVPPDVSEDYKNHHQNEELIERNGRLVWEDFSRRIDLKVCDCGCLLQAEMCGLVGGSTEASTIRKDEITTTLP